LQGGPKAAPSVCRCPEHFLFQTRVSLSELHVLATAAIAVVIVPALIPTPAGSFRVAARITEPAAMTATAA
jgi:hypothetical protein